MSRRMHFLPELSGDIVVAHCGYLDIKSYSCGLKYSCCTIRHIHFSENVTMFPWFERTHVIMHLLLCFDRSSNETSLFVTIYSRCNISNPVLKPKDLFPSIDHRAKTYVKGYHMFMTCDLCLW